MLYIAKSNEMIRGRSTSIETVQYFFSNEMKIDETKKSQDDDYTQFETHNKLVSSTIQKSTNTNESPRGRHCSRVIPTDRN